MNVDVFNPILILEDAIRTTPHPTHVEFTLTLLDDEAQRLWNLYDTEPDEEQKEHWGSLWNEYLQAIEQVTELVELSRAVRRYLDEAT